MGDGDAGVGGAGEDGTDAGDDLEGEFLAGERLGFLAAAAEDEGIAALETDDALAGAGFLDEEGVDFVLGEGVGAGFFAGVDDLGWRGEPTRGWPGCRGNRKR